MPEIRFNADTHPELLRQVRVWLESAEEERTAADVVENVTTHLAAWQQERRLRPHWPTARS